MTDIAAGPTSTRRESNGRADGCAGGWVTESDRRGGGWDPAGLARRSVANNDVRILLKCVVGTVVRNDADIMQTGADVQERIEARHRSLVHGDVIVIDPHQRETADIRCSAQFDRSVDAGVIGWHTDFDRTRSGWRRTG